MVIKLFLRKRLIFSLIVLLILIFCISSPMKIAYAAYSHTIPLDGGNQFGPSEIFDTSTTSPKYDVFFSWDSTYLYIAYRGEEANKDDMRFSNQSNKWIQFYIGGSPGTSTGVQYNNQQPALPFQAKYHVRWKVDETYTNVQQFDGVAWNDAGWNVETYRDGSSPFVKFRIKLSDMGNLDSIKIVALMLDETAASERMWAAFPPTAFTDGVDQDIGSYVEFDLDSESAPKAQINYNFKNTAVTGNTASFTFGNVTGATSVRIEQSGDDGNTWSPSAVSQPLNSSSSSATVTGLTPDTTYKFRIVVVGGVNQGSSAIVTVKTANTIPVADFINSGVTINTASFTWGAVTGAGNIVIQQSADSGQTWSTATTGAIAFNATSATVSGLSPDTTYDFRLLVTGGSNSGTSNEVAAKTDALVPVSDFASTGKSATTAAFSWSALTNAAAVGIEQSSDSGATWGSATTGTIQPTATSATVTGLSANTNYEFRLVVTGGANEGTSNVVSVTTDAIAVTDFANTAKSATTADFSWSTLTNAVTVEIEQSSDSGATWASATTGTIQPTATSATVTGLSANTNYEFRLVVTGGANEGTSNVVAVTTDAIPVTDFASTSKNATTADFSWSTLTNAVTVEIEQSSDGGATWVSSNTGTIQPTATSAIVTGLSANTNYEFRLVVTGGANEGTSNVVAVTTDAIPVTDFAGTVKSPTTADFSWSVLANAVTVEIEQSSDSGATWGSATTGTIQPTATSATVTGLSANTTYEFRLVVTGGANEGTSNVIAVTTDVIPVTDFARTAKSATTADFSWSALTNATTVGIEQSSDGGATWASSNTGTIQSTATSATVTGLGANESYEFRLVVTGGANEGTSNVVVVTTDAIPVTDFTRTAKSATTANFSWNGLTNAATVEIEQSSDGGATWGSATTGTIQPTATSATVTGLSANTNYEFRLVVTGGANEGSSNVVNVTTDVIAVTDFASTAKGATTADFSWSALANATTVEIEQSSDGGTTWVSANTGTIQPTAISATVTGLSANINYEFRLVVTGGANEGTSNVVAVTTDVIPVTDFASTSKSATTADFSWSALANAATVEIEQSTDSGITWASATTGTIQPTATSATVTGLGANASYTFRLIVTGGANEGTSNVVAVTTDAIPVTDFANTAKSAATADFSWSSLTNATTVEIEQSTDGGITWTSATTGTIQPTATSATVTGVSANRSYEFRLVVMGGANEGTSNVIAVTTDAIPVTDFASTSKSETTADFSWSLLTNATTVEIEQSSDGGATWASSNTGMIQPTATSATVTGLNANASYEFRLVVTGGANEGTSNIVAVTTDAIPVTDFALTAKSATTADFSWSTLANATAVEIEQSSDGGATWTSATTGTIQPTATSAAVTGLSANTGYEFRLVVTGGANEGTSNVVVVTTDAIPVTDFASTSKNETTADFSWSALANATTVEIEQSSDGGATWVSSNTGTIQPTATSAIVTGLSTNTNYEFRLVVTGGANEGTSNVVAVTTDAIPVTDFARTTKSATTADFSWSTLTNAITVEIEQSSDGGATWTSATTGTIQPTSTSATVTGLSANTTYEFRLVVTGGANEGTSNVVAVTTDAVPVTDFASTSKNATTADFSWSALTNAATVEIEQSSDGGATWTSAATGTIQPTATSAEVTGLSANRSYEFRLVVAGGANEGTSNVVAVTTDAVPVTDFARTVKSATTANFSWSALTNAITVEIEQSSDGGATWTSATTGTIQPTATSATVTGLSANTTYEFRLIVTGGANEGTSNVVAVTTDAIPVTDFASTSKNATTADLSWSALANATTVEVEQSSDSGATWASATTGTIQPMATSATVTGLSANTGYEFRLVVTGGANEGTSNVVAVTTDVIPVTDFSRTAKSATTASFSWNALTNAVTVEIEQSSDGGATWASATTGTIQPTATSAAVTGLSANTDYEFRLVVTGGANEGTSNVVAVTTDVIPVTDFARTAKSATTVDLSWSALANAATVEIKQSDDGGATWTSATTGTIQPTATSAAVTGLSANTGYEFRLVVTGGANEGTSNVVVVTTDAVPVTDFASTSKSATTADFSWSALANAVTVEIEQSSDGGATWTSATTGTIQPTATSAAVTGLSANTGYEFRLVVTGGANEGTSNVVVVTTDVIPVTDFARTGKSATTADFSWSTLTNAVTVEIEQSSDGGATWGSAATGVIQTTATSAAVTGLSANTAYEFRLVVTDGANEGTSNVVAVTTDAIPVTDFARTVKSATTADFSWSTLTNAVTVEIEQSSDGGATWGSATTGAIQPTATSATVTGLGANASYTFRLIVTGGANEGTSNVVAVTTDAIPVTDFANTAKSAATADFSWSSLTNTTTVEIEQSTDGGITWTSATTGTIQPTATSATVTGLSANESYQFRLVVTGGANEGTSNVVAVTTDVIPVTDFARTAKSATTADLSWSALTNAVTVEIEQSSDGGATWASTTTGTIQPTATSATVAGLTANASYEFRLAVTGGANEGTSNVVAVTTDAVPVTDFASTSKSATTADFSWSALTNATTVEIEQSDDSGATWASATTGTIQSTATNATVTGLSANESYTFRLVVTGGTNEGMSNIVSVTTDAIPAVPVPITDFTSNGKSATTADFSWSSLTNATAVEIEQSDDSGATWASSTTGTIQPTATSATVTGLSANTGYEFRLVVTGGANEGTSNTVSVTTDAIPAIPVPITDFASTGKSATTADFSWSALTNATTVEIEQSSDGGATWASATTGTIQPTATSATVTGLNANTSYTFRLVVTGGTNEGNSNTVAVTTDDLPVVSVPVSNFANTAHTTTTADFSWGMLTGASLVAIEQSSDNGTTWTTSITSAIIQATDTTATVTGLNPDTDYLFRLAVTDGSNAGASNEIAVKTDALPTGGAVPVDDFASSARTATTVDFSWSEATGATSIVIEQSSDGGITWTNSGAVIQPADTAASVGGLTPDESYVFRLVVTGGANEGISNIVAVTTNALPAVIPVPLSDFASSGNTTTTVDFSWSMATGATIVVIEQSDDAGVTWTNSTAIIHPTDTSVTVTGLNPDTDYMFRLVVTGGVNEGSSNEIAVKTDMLPTGVFPVGDFASTGHTTTTVDFSWSAATDATGIVIERSSDGGITWTNSVAVIQPGDTTAQVSGLDSEASYQFRLVVTGGDNEGVSNTVTVTTDALPVVSVPVSDFSNTAHTSATADFSWGSLNGAVSISIEHSTNGGVNWTTSTTSLIQPIATSATVTGLNPATDYMFRLVVTGGANAGNSNIIAVKTDSANPPVVVPPIVIPPVVPGPSDSTETTTPTACKLVRVANKVIIDSCFKGEDGSLKITIDEGVLNNELDQLLKNSTNNEIEFEVKFKATEYSIQIPVGLVEKYRDMKTGFKFVLVDQTYSVASKTLNMETVTQLVRTPKENILIAYTVKPATGSGNAQVQNLSRFGIYSVINNAWTLLDFNAGMPVVRRISLGGGIDAASMAGFHASQENAMQYAPLRKISYNTAELLIFCNGEENGIARYNKTFADIRSHWAKQDIELLASKFIVNGKSTNAFKPEDDITRAEFTAMITRIFCLENCTDQEQHFTDVAPEAWYYNNVQAARKTGIVQGYNALLFKPDNKITREEMATIMYRAFSKFVPELSMQASLEVEARFVDGQNIQGYAKEAIAYMAENGIIKGYPDGKFEPGKEATRAEASAMIKRFLEKINFVIQ